MFYIKTGHYVDMSLWTMEHQDSIDDSTILMSLPLHVHTEVSSESAPPLYQSAAPTRKLKTPCFFIRMVFATKFALTGSKLSWTLLKEYSISEVREGSGYAATLVESTASLGFVYEGESLMKGSELCARGAGELTAGVSKKGTNPFAGVCLWDLWGRVFARMEGVGQTMIVWLLLLMSEDNHAIRRCYFLLLLRVLLLPLWCDDLVRNVTDNVKRDDSLINLIIGIDLIPSENFMGAQGRECWRLGANFAPEEEIISEMTFPANLGADDQRESEKGLGNPWLFGRLNSEVHSDRVGSFSKPKQQYVEKRQPRQKFLSSEVSGELVSRKKRSTEEKSNVFSGPKTFDEIKEEKKKLKRMGILPAGPGIQAELYQKSDRWPFVHGPHEAGTLAWKSSKTDSAVTGAPSLENKTSAVSDERSAPVEILPNPSEAASMRAAELQIKPKPYVHLSAHTNIEDQSASPDISASECEKAPVVRSEMLLLGTDLVRSRSLVCTDQSLEEDANLLDDDRLQNHGYEEEPEYLLSVDRGMILLINERFDSIREFHERSRERMLEPIFPRKRKSFPENLGADDQRGGDLRNHLKKRRGLLMVDRKKRSTEGKSNVFSGPKTLDEIKEEKRNAKQNGNSSGRPGNSSRTTSEEFQGPKTLSEILKERNKLGSVIAAAKLLEH
ncbi:hypothetical protein RHSIM_Rhsim03G0246800 [Rhododendron simsii]|uniref:Uncharacterized protein n=1 Tax=Rhododendron simsii TaxID=118357 RepID=A0A834LR87_RHOSS|nr:hypothetical protein RHSIM_Rhsim03G0246800 [Rhododendron simsii]